MHQQPKATSLKQKLEFADLLKRRLLETYNDQIVAIGLYGSLGLGTSGPYSDIELHVITLDGAEIPGHEFIYDPFKIEISSREESAAIRRASEMSDAWPIKAGSNIHIHPLYDPNEFFKRIKKLPLQISDEQFLETMREFMIWEPYETMGKLRNAMHTKNLSYIPRGAMDFAWQVAKLIGLANKRYYTTRAKTYEESLQFVSKPAGYVDLVQLVMRGKLDDPEEVYMRCEALWEGLNAWFEHLGIEYTNTKLPW
ncbi:kanamycin nucleotidyltransferase C-terminal domain-containing protein [Alkalicoccobacillus gibsonii]|uniref:Kanamycin nucleotidyltransferase C-terminal domain-containing protein n=1 Tax=Alkalicoccobacillus gibsonii TaxID=79881 RepID=A0ABU9VEB5_9BACI